MPVLAIYSSNLTIQTKSQVQMKQIVNQMLKTLIVQRPKVKSTDKSFEKLGQN